MYKKCYSVSILKAELEAVRRKVSVQETETSWDDIHQGILQLKECCNNGGCNFSTEMVAGIRALSTQLNRAISSERSRLSGAAIELVTALLAGLGHSFAPLITLFLPTLIGLCARTNKVFTKRAKSCILAVIHGTQSQSPLPIMVRSLTHKSPAVRLVAAEGILTYLNRPAVDVTRVRLLEETIKLTSRDASAEVRKTGMKIFEAYKAILPERIESLPKKRPAVEGTATASEVKPQVLSRGVHQMTERARPVGLFQDQKNHGKPAERRAYHLHPELQRDVGTTRPIAVPNKVAASRQGALAPSLEQDPLSRRPRNQRRDTVRPSVPTKPDGEPRVGGETHGVLIPTVPLAGTGGTEIPRAIPKTRPPPFKPTRGKCVVSKLNSVMKPTAPVHPTSAATARPPSPMMLRILALKAECFAMKNTSPAVDQPGSLGLTLADLQTTAELQATQRRAVILGQKKPMRRELPVTEGFKPIGKALSSVMKKVDVSKRPLHTNPIVCSPPVPIPSSPPGSLLQSGLYDTATSRETNSSSTTPKGDPLVRAITRAPRGLTRPCVGATSSRRNVNMDTISTTPTGEPPVRAVAHVPCDCNIDVVSTTPTGEPPATHIPHHPLIATTALDTTSTTPKGEPPVRTAQVTQCMGHPKTSFVRPIQCADLFSVPSSSDKYVARRVSESLKRAPRMTYRPLRDYVEATPSPCGRVPTSTTSKTPARQPIFAASLFTPSGQHPKQFRFSPQVSSTPLSLRFKPVFSSWTSRLDKILANAFVVS